MTNTTASTIRALVRLAIESRRRRNSHPPMTPLYWCAHDAMRAYLLSARVVAIHAR